MQIEGTPMDVIIGMENWKKFGSVRQSFDIFVQFIVDW